MKSDHLNSICELIILKAIIKKKDNLTIFKISFFILTKILSILKGETKIKKERLYIFE